MDEIRLGKTNMILPKLGLGGIPIQRISEAEAVTVVRKCLDMGIRYIDTANAYTTSEERIGKAITGHRDNLVLATKTHSRTREGVESHLKLSLQHLGVEYIDLYQFHNVVNAESLNIILGPGGAMEAAMEAKKAGIVRHIGVTSHSLDMAKELVKTDLFETIMFPFNFITCEATEELLPLAREHDVGFIAMKPMAGGMLDNIPLTFKYLLQFPDVMLIPGIKEIREIEEIFPIVEKGGGLTAQEHEEIERIRQELGNRFCRRCDYCLPCPEEIPIAMVMTMRSFAKAWPASRFFSSESPIGQAMEKAANCTECGACETRCPYELKIMDIIDEHSTYYQTQKRNFLKQATSVK